MATLTREPQRPFRNLDSIQYYNSNEGVYECPQCNKKFRILKSLKTHMYVDCSGWKFRCEFCMKLFKRKYDVRRHIFRRHPSQNSCL